jgi:hypothetical protein
MILGINTIDIDYRSVNPNLASRISLQFCQVVTEILIGHSAST